MRSVGPNAPLRPLNKPLAVSEIGPRPIIVAGPTGAGKSAFAAALALRLGGEVIGADAFQLYDGLPILTAQPPPELRSLVPHHLIGCLPLGDGFDVAQYAQRAWACIGEVEARGRVAIVTGGTGLYLKALTHGLADIPRPDAALRQSLEALPLEKVVEWLREKDPAALGNIDSRNPLRVRRALEIVLTTGRPLAESRREWLQNKGKFRGITLSRTREELQDRIAENVAAMFASGVVEEVRAAAHAGSGASRAIGFREIQSLLNGQISEPDCREAIFTATRRYAKRQLTWCRTQFTFAALNLTEVAFPEPALTLALALLDDKTE